MNLSQKVLVFACCCGVNKIINFFGKIEDYESYSTGTVQPPTTIQDDGTVRVPGTKEVREEGNALRKNLL